PTDLRHRLEHGDDRRDAEAMTGMAAHLLLVTQSIMREHWFDADGELLVVAQRGGLRFRTEFGVIEMTPGEICIILRGVIFRVELIDAPRAPTSAKITAILLHCRTAGPWALTTSPIPGISW